ncbi:MAG: hypothetical protein UV74_C0013G0121 [Candidatus Woesebacteria bacterium GW2011_GWB1_43_14]|uniref:DoxX family protein n=1 Tax=Candidatus Woesebacteria bacterium GW2011_GWB1_43_14 TaxID=1618578 RepID=A0A0G1DH18_9BACT|nr:MAG: hypothetical protein UV51_C0005G0103 [Candidatus Woesebacteria bacterium GW2011_GWC1_42_9]KKS96999.1 MAG: hypothetical protein UV74_C0013G0121 [Candidatus Woesebacteria bacterium GW2011_GWB1_43_14]
MCDECCDNLADGSDIFIHMKGSSLHILRVGLAITFLWVGLLILKDPVGWGGYINDSFLTYFPVDIKMMMQTTAIFDLVVGLWLLLDYKLWVPASLAVIHLASVLLVSGINAITVRDIGLLSALLALLIECRGRDSNPHEL